MIEGEIFGGIGYTNEGYQVMTSFDEAEQRRNDDEEPSKKKKRHQRFKCVFIDSCISVSCFCVKINWIDTRYFSRYTCFYHDHHSLFV